MSRGIFALKHSVLPRILAVCCIAAFTIHAKTGFRSGAAVPIDVAPRVKADAAFMASYESRMSGFLEARLNRGGAAIRSASLRSDADLLMLPRLWDRLSPAFKTLYAAAITIPDDYAMRVSPGGHFEIFYATDDTAAMVDPTDTLSIGGSGNWRTRVRSSNGVPDYIDEVGWALDSSWSLHVDRHRFVTPLPYRTSRYGSSRYKVVVTRLGDDDYGYTFPMGRNPDSARGYTSLFQIRNRWVGPTWQRLGYQERPLDGVRVTCAHELFHAVQYSMTWDTPSGDDLDDFPLTFIEGTAVLMEEIAFDYINDYLQYATTFFSDPRMSFFDASYGMRAYSNSLIAKFIYEKGGAPLPDILFFTRIFFANYAAVTPFHANLRASALASGTPWTIMLNRFHAASFYSGTRADTARFIADAPLLGQWSFTYDSLPESYSITRSVNPYGTQLFAFTNDGIRGDTLFIAAEGAPSTAVPHPLWALTCIARGAARADTAIAIPIDSSGRGTCRIDDWHARREAIILATNGHPADRLAMTVSLIPCPVYLRQGQSRIIEAVSQDGSGAVTVSVKANSDLRCAMEVGEVAAADVSIPASLIRVSPLWRLTFPSFWGEEAAITLTMRSTLSTIDSLRRTHSLPLDSITLRRFDAATAAWAPIPSAIMPDDSAFVCESRSVHPGIYALVAAKLPAPDSSGNLAIANLGRIKLRQYIRFKAPGITGITIYAINGTQVCSYVPGISRAFQPDKRFSDAVAWKLENGSGKTVIPGPYLAHITRVDPLSGKKTSSRHKVMVLP